MIDLAFVRQLDRFSLILNKRVTSNYSGERPTHDPGSGLVFRDHASYSPGDDFRAIDWKVWARTDRLFVKRYESERNLTVHIVLDYSASMGFGTGKYTKADYSAMVGLGFAYMALKNNEKFVLSTFADVLELLRPRKGRRQLAGMVHYLDERKPKGSTDIAQALAKYKRYINTRSMVIIVSDFLYEPDEMRDALARLSKNFKHEIRLVQVLDKVELDLQGLEGDYKLHDSESNATMRTHINPLLKRSYVRQLKQHNAKIKKIAEEVGAQYFTVSTETPIFDAFYEMLGK